MLAVTGAPADVACASVVVGVTVESAAEARNSGVPVCGLLGLEQHAGHGGGVLQVGCSDASPQGAQRDGGCNGADDTVEVAEGAVELVAAFSVR